MLPHLLAHECYVMCTHDRYYTLLSRVESGEQNGLIISHSHRPALYIRYLYYRYLSTADSTVILLDAQSLARRYSCRILLYRTSKLPVSEYLSDGSEHYSCIIVGNSQSDYSLVPRLVPRCTVGLKSNPTIVCRGPDIVGSVGIRYGCCGPNGLPRF